MVVSGVVGGVGDVGVYETVLCSSVEDGGGGGRTGLDMAWQYHYSSHHTTTTQTGGLSGKYNNHFSSL